MVIGGRGRGGEGGKEGEKRVILKWKKENWGNAK